MTNKKVIQTIFLAIGIAAIMAACSKPQEAGVSCAAPLQPAGIVFPRLLVETTADNLTLNIKVRSASAYIDELRLALVAAHGPVAAQLGQIQISMINRELISLNIPRNSPAVKVIANEIDAGKILFVEEDYKTFSITPSEGGLMSAQDLVDQWPQLNVGTYEAWKTTRGSKKIIVAVIDTGVDYTHKDLSANIWKNEKEVLNGIDDDKNGFIDDIRGWDFSTNTNNPMANDPDAYHGTHVAGTIAGTGGTGHAPNVTIMPVKYLDSTGSGTISNAIRAIDYAVQNGAKILNNSWGSASYSQFLGEAIDRARQAGVLVVAAAGNGDSSGHGIDLNITPFYPAGYSYANVISVGASDKANNLTAWSNFGSKIVDVAAPGLGIVSTRNGNAYATLSGTSMATPLVSGVLGLIWSAKPGLSFAQVKNILLSTVDKEVPLSSKIVSAGRVNAFRAVQLALATSDGNAKVPDAVNAPTPAPLQQQTQCQR